MSEARKQILATIRRGLQRGSLEGVRRAELEARLANPPRNVIPARAQLPHPEQVALFVKMTEHAAATLEQVASPEAVPAAVVAFLTRETLPTDLVMAPDLELAALPWGEQPALRIERRAAVDGDKVSVTPAFAGIAETGTLMLLSGPHSPTTLNFLPDTHIVVLHAARIIGTYEDAWSLLRAHESGMPRTVNYITGPSRSADIEQTVQMGAHGPIRLHIVLVGE
ncbi:MAG: LUD domain-containing protein [Candidatus Competibacteraceae bacterium]